MDSYGFQLIPRGFIGDARGFLGIPRDSHGIPRDFYKHGLVHTLITAY